MDTKERDEIVKRYRTAYARYGIAVLEGDIEERMKANKICVEIETKYPHLHYMIAEYDRTNS